MKILLIASPNPYGRGGEVRSYEVLRRLQNFGIHTNLLTDLNNVSVLNKLSDYIDCIYKAKCFKNHELCITLMIKKAMDLRNNDFDLIVSHSEHPRYSLSAYSIAKLLRRPWTAIINSYIYIDPYTYKKSLTRFIRNTFAIHCLNKTLVHLVSYAIQDELQKRGFGFKYYEVLETPVGIDWEIIDHVRKEFKKEEKEYDLAFMGVLSAEKGIYDIAYIVYKLKKKLGKSIKVVLIGKFTSFTEEAKYLSLLNKLQIQNNVKIKGYLSGEVKYRELLKAKLFVFPSRVDVFPISILEALALGLPVVTLDLPYSREFKTNAVIKARSIDELVNIINALLSDDELREMLSTMGRRYAMNYTWEKATLSEYKAYLKTVEWLNEVK
uniref:Glycosyltransferase n=1 Tax=Ignisphaera aggregans TaxID=334771 RepID=A0A7J3YTS0_9CREN